MDTSESFAYRLSEAIRTSGYSRADVAKVMDVKPATVKSWCVGRRSPTVQRLLDLCKFLGVEPSAMFIMAEPHPDSKRCPACGRVFRRRVGYRIHLALRAHEDHGHRALNAAFEN